MKKLVDFLAGFPMTIFSGIMLVISLILMMADLDFLIDPAWVTILISGIPMVYLALTRLIYHKWISSALLISIAMAASILIGEIFAAGEVAFIMAIGAILEDSTVNRAKKGLSQLMSLSPVEGRKICKNGDDMIEQIIPAGEIQKGDLLRVLPGEKIPADGFILSGSTSVDQSVMTGESLPADKTVGDNVFCGTINCYGSIDIQATSTGNDSSLQKLIRMVQDAEEKKAPMQRIADQWSVWLVPIALLIAIGGFFINWWLGKDLMAALNRGVTVLVVFCPCALALATPTSIMAAIGQATKHGIIIKSGEALETMGKVNTITFDKTGTLTYGKPEVSDIIVFDDQWNCDHLLSLAASAESRSEHPLAKAIVDCAAKKNIPMAECADFHMEAGLGIRAKIDDIRLLCGNEKYLRQNGILISSSADKKLEKLHSQGAAVILVAVNGTCAGLIALSDTLRPDAEDVINKLTSMDTHTVLLSGDHTKTASYFASRIGISEIHADLLPAQKVEHIKRLQKEGNTVCMIGDGINDAPALKAADVGIAMGSMGSDISIEAADIALMSDDISKIPYLKKLSYSTVRTIKGNIIASMCINAVAVTLSVLGVLNPVTGALVHNAGSVLVVLNAALLYDRNF